MPDTTTPATAEPFPPQGIELSEGFYYHAGVEALDAWLLEWLEVDSNVLEDTVPFVPRARR